MSSLICKCGKVKESTQKKICNDCRKENKRLKSREDARKFRARYGSVVKRGLYCCQCRGLKEHQERGYCLACERARWKDRDKPDCATCGKKKENIRDSYCDSCKRIKYQEKSAEEGRRYKHPSGRAPTCSICGALKEGSYIKESHCSKCRYLASKAKRPFRTDEQIFKENSRRITYLARKDGILIKKPCEVCNTEIDIQAHHDDYTKPLEVRWLCRKHHNEHHKNLLK